MIKKIKNSKIVDGEAAAARKMIKLEMNFKENFRFLLLLLKIRH